jgi:hypothetical protein
MDVAEALNRLKPGEVSAFFVDKEKPPSDRDYA